MGAMCYSNATKREITHIKYRKKNMYGSICYTATTTKNVHHIEYCMVAEGCHSKNNNNKKN